MNSSASRASNAELLTKNGACRRAGIGNRQLDRPIASGEIPVYQIGGWRRVRWTDVARWIEKQRVPMTDHARRRVEERLQHEAGAGGR